jgi:hypothetical protein
LPHLRYLKLFDFLDKDEKHSPHYPPLVNIVVPDTPADWAVKEGPFLSTVKNALQDKDIKFDKFRGYMWVLDNPHALATLLEGKTVLPNEFSVSWGRIS